MRNLPLLLATASLAAACGSTVPLSQQQALTSSVGDGLTATVSGGTTGATATGAGAGSGPTGSVAGSGTGTGSAVPGAVSSAAPRPTSGTSPSGRGATARGPVKVGVLYIDGADQAAAALGIGLSTGDARAQGKAIVDWLNTHGGLAGRKITPVFYGMPAAQLSNNPSQAYQAACTSLVQDSRVSFVVSYVNPPASALACFAKGDVTLVDDVSLVADETQQKYAAHFSAPGDFAPGRLIRELVDALWRTGWLTPASKVGSYTFDTRENVALVESALVPALAAHGLKIVKRAAVSNGADGVSQSNSAALQYRSAGVDRILPISANPLFVMQAASTQGYHPQYALYSSLGPGALVETAAPKDQLVGAAGIGWQPYLDIGAGTRPGPVSANETTCFAIMKAAGQASTTATVKGLQLSLCNVLFFLQAAADRVGSVPSDVIRRASPLLGASYRPANTFRTDVSRRVDGAAGYRDLAYRTDCSCFQYVSGVRTAS